jgi:hypothetical protein
MVVGGFRLPIKGMAWKLGNPSTPQEEIFQKAHCKTINVVERAFGVLKQRFR